MRPGSSSLRRLAAVLPATLALAAALVVPLAPPTAVVTHPLDPASLTPPPEPDAVAMESEPEEVVSGTGATCPGYNGLQMSNPVRAVMQARFALPNVPASTVGVGADIDWRLERDNPSWHMWLHTLKWTGSLIVTYGATGDESYLQRAVAIAQDWLAENDVAAPYRHDLFETVAGRTHTLLCLDRYVDARWLDQALLAHAEQLVGFYSGASNHGVDQSIGLLGVGCNLGRDDYVDLAISRMGEAATTMLDAQGVTNEQSTGYATYSYARLLALREAIEECGRTPPEPLQRVDLVPAFVAHATRPDGTLVPLGDTVHRTGPLWEDTATEFVMTRGRQGTPPPERVKVYSAGYVFGRSGWGEARPWDSETHYSLRFGPGRHLHGHDDKQSLTFYARGREVLIDPGHNGYEQTPMRSYLVSPDAHNVLTVRDVPYASSAVTELTHAVPGDLGDYLAVTDTAYEGVSRTRRVLMLRDPDVAVVLDTARSDVPHTYTQYWHLPADMTATVTGRGGVTATNPAGERTTVVQVPLPGQVLPPGSTQVVEGRTDPVQGWWSPAVYEQEPAPVVAMTRAGRSVAMLTLVAPVAPGVEVSASARAVGATTFVDIRIDGETTTVRLGPDGMMTR